MIVKTCSKCGQEKEYTEFYKRNGENLEYSDFCKECDRKYKEESLAIEMEYLSRIKSTKNTKLKESILNDRKEKTRAAYENYGNKCSCCGEKELKFLSIDKPRKRTGINRPNLQDRVINNAIRSGFPTDYRTLCWNCKNAIDMFGICPHEEKKGEQNG